LANHATSYSVRPGLLEKSGSGINDWSEVDNQILIIFLQKVSIMNIKKSACLFAVLLFSISLFAQAVSANQTDAVRFSLTVWDQPLEKVLSDIEQITGFTIIVDGKIKSVPVSGIYNNVTVSDFFSIAVKEKNITVSVNADQKIITISKIQTSKNNSEDFLASEMEYIIQARQSIKKPTNDEMRNLKIDPLTGKAWSEVEEQNVPSKEQKNQGTQLSQSEFLEAESDYITTVKKATKTAQKRDKDEENVDPLSGKNWEEIEAELQSNDINQGE